MLRYTNHARLLGSTFYARVANWGTRSLIRSIQRTTITLTGVTSNTVTITAVVPENTRLNWLGNTYSLDSDPDTSSSATRIALTNATTVTATRASNGNSAIVSFEAIEYMPGLIRSIQRGIIGVTGVTSNTATVNAVTPSKSTLRILGWSTTDTLGFWAEWGPVLVLTDATTVTAAKGVAAGSVTVGYELVEWW